MKQIEPSKLLHDLYSQVERGKPVIPQLTRLYVHSLWDQDLYTCASWKGWLTLQLIRPSEKKENDLKTFAIFQTALEQVTQNKESLGEVDAHFFPFVVTLYQEIEQAKKSVSYSAKSKPSPSSEIQSLQSYKTPKTQSTKSPKENFQVIYEKSLLRERQNADVVPIDAKLFLALFSSAAESDIPSLLDYLEQVCTKNPEWARESFSDLLPSLKQALSEDRQGLNALRSKLANLPPEKRQKRLKKYLNNLSSDLSEKVQSLNPNTKEKHLLCVSYGPKTLDLSFFLEMLANLPPSARSSLPEPLQKMIQAGPQSFDPEKMAEDLLHKMFQEIRQTLPQGDLNQLGSNQLGSTGHALFPSEDRHLPEWISPFLPTVLGALAENAIQGGVLGNLHHFLSDPLARDALNWLAQHGEEALQADGRNILLKEVESSLQQLMQRHLHEAMSTLQHSGLDFLQKLGGAMPSTPLEIVGLDRCLLSGSLWLEFTPQSDQTFHVDIYSQGKALDIHPLGKDGNPYLVMRLQNVKRENLTDEFFYILLYRHYAPHWDSGAIIRAHDFYTGPLKSLRGEIAQNQINDPTIAPGQPSTPWEMVKNFLLKQDKETHFHLKLTSLLDFCRPFLTGPDHTMGKLDDETAALLNRCLSELENEAKQLPALKGKERVQATFAEIRKALEAHQHHDTNPYQDFLQQSLEGLDIYEHLSQMMSQGGLTAEKLASWRETVAWAFGDEIAELMDSIIPHLKPAATHSILQTSASKPKPSPAVHKNEGWLLKNYFFMFLHLLERVEMVRALCTYYSKQVISPLNIATLLYYAPSLLPSSTADWIYRIKDAVFRLAARTFFQMIWNSLIDEKKRDELQQLHESYKQKLRQTKDLLTHQNRLSYELPFSLGMVSKETPQSSPTASTQANPLSVPQPITDQKTLRH